MQKTFKRSLHLFFIALSFLTSSQTLFANTMAPKVVSIRQIFPRDQGYESRIINVLGAQFSIDVNTDLGRAFADLSLLAAEVYYVDNDAITADRVISEIGNPDGRVRAGVQGLLAALVMNEVRKTGSDPELIALKNWSTELFRSMKIRTAKGILDEYQKWDADFCQYKADGYKAPAGCGLGGLDQMQLYSRPSPPQNAIAKAGLKSLFPNDADNVAKIIAIGSTIATVGTAAMALTTSLGYSVSLASTVSLHTVFGGGLAGGAASGALGAVGWAGAVAAPIAAVVLVVVIGTIEGIRVVEATKVEPMLKMKLGQAISEHISLPNVLTDINSRNMFFMAFMEAASKGFKLTPANINGEVRFYCQAGYVAKFSVTYSADIDKTGYNPNVKTFTKTTQDLNVGRDELIVIPYNATRISVQGQFWDGINWKPISEPLRLGKSTFMCYTAYGTVFNPNYKTDCPEVGSMIAKKNELTVTQGGAYTAWVYLSYKQNGKVLIAQDQQGFAMGWRKTYKIPADATQIYLYIREATGLTWDPWKAVVEKTWPVAPNECIKIYGTTLDPKWNAECN